MSAMNIVTIDDSDVEVMPEVVPELITEVLSDTETGYDTEVVVYDETGYDTEVLSDSNTDDERIHNKTWTKTYSKYNKMRQKASKKIKKQYKRTKSASELNTEIELAAAQELITSLVNQNIELKKRLTNAKAGAKYLRRFILTNIDTRPFYIE